MVGQVLFSLFFPVYDWKGSVLLIKLNVNNLKKRIIFLFILIFIPLFLVFSQEELTSEIINLDEENKIEVQIPQTGNETTTETVSDKTVPKYEAGAVFIINSFDFKISGITRQFALINKGELEEGEEITGFSNLEKYIHEKQQILYNERALESVSIDYFIGQKREDGKYPVDLLITTKDSGNIIVLPKPPQYDTNSGLKLTVNYRDYNFLGTLVPLRFDIGYRYDEYKRNYFTFMLDTDTPFVFLNLNWNFIFYHSIDVSPNLDRKFIYKNVTGFQVQLPYKKTVFIVGFRESFFVNQEHDEAQKIYYGDNQKGLYLSSNPYVHWVIPTGFEVRNFGQIYYIPYFSANINHELSSWPLDDIKNEKTLSLGHSLNFGRVDWNDNFRSGLYVNISNGYSYSFRNKRYDVRPVDINYQLSFTYHHILKKDFLGASGRVLLRHWLFDVKHESAGDVLRGIRDKDIHANFMLSLNLDLPVKVLEVRPADWFGISKFRIFNFDFYLGPIMDTAIFHHPDHQTAIGFRNFLLTGGIEAVFFPLRWRSLHLRMSFGLNLSRMALSDNIITGGYNPSSAGKYELYMGTDFHF
jgi:hypothetical protein